MSDIERFYVSGCGNHDCDPLVFDQDGDYVYFDEYEKLNAENAGLRTGYQAYERVNAELKAENEALRTALGPLLTHWDDVKPGESMNVDRARSAMRWGECP